MIVGRSALAAERAEVGLRPIRSTTKLPLDRTDERIRGEPRSRVMSTTRDARRTNDASRAWLGSLSLGVFLLLATMLIVERTIGLPFRMPRSWYANAPLWWAFAAGSLVLGGWLLVNHPEAPSWRPQRAGRRFGHVVLFTRAGCHLCDRALETLESYRRWLPPVETVDVDTDPALAERHGERVPVVEFDGVPRFAGRVDEFELRRLIEGTPPE